MAPTPTPVLHYFNIKGRGEPIRMTFAACGVAYEEKAVDYAAMKAEAGTATSPFGQAPFVDVEGTRLSQMTAIMRYIAAKYQPTLLGGPILVNKACVDQLLNSIDDIYLKYISCVYQEKLAAAARDALWAKHFDPATKGDSNGGAHMSYLVGYLERTNGPFLSGTFTIADIFFYFTLEAFTSDKCFGAKVCAAYPSLAAYMKEVSGVAGLKDRLADPARATLPLNGNGEG